MKTNLMTHIVAGYPDLQTSEKLVEIMDKVGVSFVEIQIPFSDPVSDGQTLMNAQKISLENNTKTEDVFQLVKRLQTKVKVPLLLMTYYNIVYTYGVDAFCKRAASLGIYGLIIPDIPLDEEPTEQYLTICKKYGLHPIQIISPLTPEKRLKKIAEVASGFVYCVSREGLTGSKTDLNPNLEKYLNTVRQYVKLPLALGFGISEKSHVQTALKNADIAVMGSVVVNILNNARDGEKLEAVEKFLTDILK
jgi:tryptophan synthase alpha subunit